MGALPIISAGFQSRHRWETAQNALSRYEDSIEQINKEYEGKNILIVSHGTVMSLYFAKLTGTMGQIVEREKKLGYCDYGIVKDGHVVKDIV
ncbi:histidine phosphatase family protein [Candidatus Woesearchaeota archaeon]|nr:histidine phosphatase family protein [Candidatus Woesearchaeota archaeon]